MQVKITIIVLCVVGAVVMTLPLSMSRTLIGPAYSPQDATDAVQDQRIKHLEQTVAANTAAISETSAKMNWIIGGIAGIYGLMAVMGFVNANLRRG